MTKLAELLESGVSENLPQIARQAVRLLWHDDYWDGPLSGMLLYQGKEYWFQMIAENDDPDLVAFYRRFAVLELTEAQLQEEHKWHTLFQEKVGTHTDYDVAGQRELGALKPQELWHEFYDAYKECTPSTYLENTVIGWMEI
jgi:hypothetical protein